MTEDLNTLREALEPCPFCGNPGEYGNVLDWHGVGCQTLKCPGLRSALYHRSKEAAFAAWNRRAPRLEAAAVPDAETQQFYADLIASVKEMRAARPAVPKLSREDVVRLAERFHEAYERLAPSFGYETRAETRKFDPATSNGKLMIAVCSEIVRSAPVGEVKPGAWPDSVSDAVLQTPEPDRWLQDEPRPVPIFHMATLMRYGERCAEAGMSAITRAVKPAHEVEEVRPVAWEGGEGWEALAWHLCAEEHGEDACNELIWEGGPVPEPWGDRWMKYEPEAKRMIALVRQFTTPPAPPEGWKLVPVEPTPDMIAAAAINVLPTPSAADFELSRQAARIVLAHPAAPPSASLEHVAAAMATIIPAHRAMLAAAPQPGDKPLEEPAQVAPEHQGQVDQMAADAEARREKERGILLEAANHLEGDGHFMPAEDADWAAGWIRRQIGAGATP